MNEDWDDLSYPSGKWKPVGDAVEFSGTAEIRHAQTNPSGISPTEFKVLIDPKPVDEKRGSIIIPDATLDKEKYATTEGVIIAVSPLAFSYATADEWQASGGKPRVGQTVLYARYADMRPKGKDGKEYVLLNDKDICATIED